ncbi:hypothetical protein P9J64_02360 [Deltaproteobacteria bacterium IMCC39524]|nr:hypothetical protein [Deltaproteobacteria bacterium IMCC39524]
MEELKQAIDAWGEVNRIEHFSRDAEAHPSNLNPKEHSRVIARLNLAREMFSSIDALDYFRHWRTPSERLEE